MNDYNQNNQYNPYQPQQQAWPHMTMGNWLTSMLLMLIPIANIILMFMWAFGSNVNPSKKAYFQASLIMAAIGIGLAILLGGLLSTFLLSLVNSMS